MENLNKDELMSAIHSMINEGLRSEHEAYDGTTKFNIRRYVNGLIEEGHRNPKLMSYLLEYERALNEGEKDFLLFEQFGRGLEKFAKGNKSIKNVLTQMNETLKECGYSLPAFRVIESIDDEYAKKIMFEAYNDYLKDKNEYTKSNVLEAIDNLQDYDENAAMRLTVFVTEDVNRSPEFFATKFINEAQQMTIDKRIEERNKEKLAGDIFKKVQKYINEKNNEAEIQARHINEKYSLRGIANNNGLKLYEHISNILKSDASRNENLKNILVQYSTAIGNGQYEERLYETLVQNITRYNYLLPVEKAIKAINEAVEKKEEEITLTKILEEMKDSYNSYIYVDLIEEDVARYVLEPSATNRVQLRNALMPYASDPYINEMFKVLYTDKSIRANELQEQAMNIMDQISIIKEDASIENIYSPVQYVKENESIFNVHGQYYTKKNNKILALEESKIAELDPRFTALVQLVNDKRVQILEDRIILTGSENYATIYEGYVDIAGYRESRESLRRLDEMCIKYQNYDTDFYIMCSCLLENFNNIAKIDWAKRVTLNENQNLYIDLFKLDENIYMTTHNDSLLQHTFYQNVNPIQCKRLMNEHMGIHVSQLFTDMLPSQDKIILKLNENKAEYEAKIKECEDMIEKLEDAKENTTTDSDKKKLEDSISEIKDALKDIQAEYEEWQKNTDDYMNAKPSDAEDDKDEKDSDGEQDNVTTEISNEPLDADEVEQYKDEMMTPINAVPANTEVTDVDVDDEEVIDTDAIVSDDEFNDMLDGAQDAEDDVIAPEYPVDDVSVDETPVDDETVIDTEDVDNDVKDKEEFATVDIDSNSVDDTFEEEPYVDDATDTEDVITTEPEEDENIPAVDDTDDEIITDEDEPAELPSAKLQTVDAEKATDLFGGNVNDPVGLEATQNDVLFNPNIGTEDFQIVNVTFDENVKLNKIMKSGKVLVLVPMISQDGMKRVDTKTYNFYLSADNKPIIETTEDMTTSMYNGIVNSISQHPSYKEVCQTGEEITGTASELPVNLDDSDSDYWEEEYIENGSDEDRGEYNIGGDDEEYEISDDMIDTDLVDSNPAPSGVISADTETEEPVDTDVDVDDILMKTTDNATAEDTEDAVDLDNDIDLSDLLGDDEVEDIPADDTELPAEDADEYVFADSLFDENDDATEEPVKDPVPTYTDGETEYELPAADDDDSIIPESYRRRVTSKKINENRKSLFLGKKSNKKGFFVNEGTAKPSKKVTEIVAPLSKEKFGGSDVDMISVPNKQKNLQTQQGLKNDMYVDDVFANKKQMIHRMYDYANKCAANANDIDNAVVDISDVSDFHCGENVINWITFTYNDIKYVVYELADKIYCRDYDEFSQLKSDIEDGVPTISVDNFRHEYKDIKKPIQYYNANSSEDCFALVNSIFQSMLGKSYSEVVPENVVQENCIIRKKVGLTNNNEIDRSLKFKEAKYGTKEENDFKQEVEDKQKKDGTIGVLDQKAEESVKPKLPNVHMMTEAKKTQKKVKAEDIVYEPGDRVVVDGQKGRVLDAHENEKGEQDVTVMINGQTKLFTTKEIKPDPAYNTLSVIDNFELNDDKLSNMTNKKEKVEHRDLNDSYIPCSVVVDGHKLNYVPYYASLKDIAESSDIINLLTNTDVSDGGDVVMQMPAENVVVDRDDWPYAVIAGQDDEPIRKIKVDVTSYVNASDEDDLVTCLVSDKETQFPKKLIKIIV